MSATIDRDENGNQWMRGQCINEWVDLERGELGIQVPLHSTQVCHLSSLCAERSTPLYAVVSCSVAAKRNLALGCIDRS